MTKLGVVLFGAGKYDNHRELNNSSFARSAGKFRTTTADTRIIPGVRSGVLDIYDQPLSVKETLDDIMNFVSRDHDDIIIYYCGHGDVGLREGDTRAFLRTSNRERRDTLLDMVLLIHDVTRAAPNKRIYFVLDACYSGSAMDDGETDVSGADAILNSRLSAAVADAGHGTAVLAASGRPGVALAKRQGKLTPFTDAIVRCLREGLVHRRELPQFSWLDLNDGIVRVMRDRLGPEAAIPTLVSFGQSSTDMTRTPFFSNAAFVALPDGATPLLPAADDALRELLYWRVISELTPAEVLEDFLGKFPDGTYAGPALALLQKRVATFNAQQIKTYLSIHPDTAIIAVLEARLVVLCRDRIRNCNDLAELERVAAECGQGELGDEIQSRVETLRAEQFEREAWDRVKESPVPEPLLRFLDLYPAGPFRQQAEARLAELAAATRNRPFRRDRLIGVTAALRAALQRPHMRRAGALVLVLAAAIGVFWSIGQKAVPPGIDGIRRDFEAAGTDAIKLRMFIAQCVTVHCSLEQDARDKLAEAEAVEQLQQARIEADQTNLDATGTDLNALRQFVQQCEVTSCSLQQQAKLRLVAAEAAEDASRAAQNKELTAVPDDVASLQAYVEGCRREGCLVLDQAQDRLDQAAIAERTRKIAQAGELAAVPDRADNLQAFIDRCQAGGCLVLDEANDRLRKATEAVGALAAKSADQASLTQVDFNANVNYDMHGGDFPDETGKPRLITTDAESCLASCRATDGCVAVSYDKWNGVCYPKRNLTELTLDPHPDTSIRADLARPRLAVTDKHFCAYSGSFLVGEEIQRVQSQSVGDCEGLCRKDAGCVAYTFYKSTRLCSALRAVSGRQSRIPDAVSAVRTQYPCR